VGGGAGTALAAIGIGHIGGQRASSRLRAGMTPRDRPSHSRYRLVDTAAQHNRKWASATRSDGEILRPAHTSLRREGANRAGGRRSDPNLSLNVTLGCEIAGARGASHKLGPVPVGKMERHYSGSNVGRGEGIGIGVQGKLTRVSTAWNGANLGGGQGRRRYVLCRFWCP
jgi:hypothetical protein